MPAEAAPPPPACASFFLDNFWWQKFVRNQVNDEEIWFLLSPTIDISGNPFFYFGVYRLSEGLSIVKCCCKFELIVFRIEESIACALWRSSEAKESVRKLDLIVQKKATFSRSHRMKLQVRKMVIVLFFSSLFSFSFPFPFTFTFNSSSSSSSSLS